VIGEAGGRLPARDSVPASMVRPVREIAWKWSVSRSISSSMK
jgi:hypothetical protein